MDGDDGRAVRTGSFELCDGEGRVRALLGLGPGGLVALDLADEAGRVRASRAGPVSYTHLTLPTTPYV